MAGSTDLDDWVKAAAATAKGAHSMQSLLERYHVGTADAVLQQQRL
jgi:hypothetical protein